MNYLQDCTTFQSEDLGVGLEWLLEHNRVWMLASWQIEILRMPQFLETITVGTFPYDFKGSLGMRNLVIMDQQGEYLLKGNSYWVLVDRTSGHPVKVLEEDRKAYVLEEPLDMEYLPRRITIPAEGTRGDVFRVMAHHLDTNHHVNNSQYIQMAAHFLPAGFKTKRIRVEYKKQAVFNDEIIPYVVELEGGYLIVLEDNVQNSWATVEFTGGRE